MNDTNIMVAAISLLGTIIGSITGVLVSNKLTNYRIEQLEKKLDRYASNTDELKERLILVEQSTRRCHERLDDHLQTVK